PVEHLVDPLRELVVVLLVDRGDERLDQALEQRPPCLVSLVLELADAISRRVVATRPGGERLEPRQGHPRLVLEERRNIGSMRDEPPIADTHPISLAQR